MAAGGAVVGGYFAVLSTRGMANERREEGLNSSLMAWRAGGGIDTASAHADSAAYAWSARAASPNRTARPSSSGTR